MQPAEVIRIEGIAKNELNKTDNDLDNITKWLYNDRSGTPYFALYSTENDENPTILYASKNKSAEEEYNFVLECSKELEATHDDGKTEIINKILENFGNTDNLRAVYSVVPSNGQPGNGNVAVHSGQPGFGVSRALRICLQDSFERRTSVEKEQKYSTKRQSSVSEEASDYILDTKEYQDILKIIDQRYNLTYKKILSPKAIERLAGKLLSNSKSKYDKGALTERLSALFDYMANSNELVWEDVIYMY